MKYVELVTCLSEFYSQIEPFPIDLPVFARYFYDFKLFYYTITNVRIVETYCVSRLIVRSNDVRAK